MAVAVVVAAATVAAIAVVAAAATAATEPEPELTGRNLRIGRPALGRTRGSRYDDGLAPTAPVAVGLSFHSPTDE
jgi:hypothetical protein